jgi:hypothetical protein
VCPLTVTMPGTANSGTDVTQTSVGVNGTTSAGNETNTGNNATSVTVALIDAVSDSATLGSVAGGTITILGNDQLGATTNPTVGLNGIRSPTIVTGSNTTLSTATINGSDQIVVPAGTLPGAYTVEYEICTDPDQTPLACDRAIVTITVNNTTVDVVSAVNVPAVIGPGQTVVGSVVCTNNGAVAATDMTCTATTTVSGASVSVGTCAPSPGSTLASVAPGGTLTCSIQVTAPGTRGGVDETATQVIVNGSTSATNESSGSTNNNTSNGALALIDAVNDGGSVGSIAGGTVVILGNDRLGAPSPDAPPTIGTGGILVPTIVTGANTTLTTATINPATGVINVPPGTASGTYTVEYEICAQAVATACDRAIATINVSDTSADMVSAISGLPPTVAPGQTVTGTLTCTNNGPAAATSPTCAASTSTAGATVVISGACTPALPLTSLSATTGSNTIVCPISVTAPTNPAAPGDVVPTAIAVAGTTSATNETATTNNGSTGSVGIVDAVDDSATIGSIAGGSLNVLTNDGSGASPITIGSNATVAQQPGATAPVGGTPLTLDPATGNIAVPPGSVPGVYTVPYLLCALPATTPSTCDTALATITVDNTAADMTSQITGLPASIAPGATVSGSLVCTNAGPASATSPTCTVSTTTPGAVVTIIGPCTPVQPVSSLPATSGSNTITCPISVTAPANPGAPGDVVATTVVVDGTTSAVNEPAAAQANNGSTTNVAIVDAVNDSANLTASGGTLNVLTNDGIGANVPTLGGAGTGSVVQLPGATAPVGGTPLTLDPATGIITVPPNAVPGVYTVPYSLCSANPTTACDNAVATITVGAGAADMTASFPSSGAGALPTVVAPGQTYTGLQLTCTNLGPNLALSPTCAVSTDIGTVSGLNCTPNAPSSLAPNAAISCTFSYTTPGTLGGTDLPPQIVRFTGIAGASNDNNPANNVVQGVSPSGQAPIVIDAIDDSASVPSSTGGTVTILTNDQLGTTPNPSVSSTGITPPVVVPGANTTLPNPSINSSNQIVVAPGTPPGTYTVEYQICAQATPAVCDNAIATITITGDQANGQIEAVPALDPRALFMLALALVLVAGFASRRQASPTGKRN